LKSLCSELSGKYKIDVRNIGILIDSTNSSNIILPNSSTESTNIDQNIISNISNDSTINSVCTDTEEMIDRDIILQTCDNCKRKEIVENEFEFTIITSNQIKRNRSYTFVQRTTPATDTVFQYHVCYQCYNHLTLEDRDEANKNMNTWPGFIWNLMHSQEIKRCYNADYIWILIPLQWRKWWLDSIYMYFSAFFGHVTIEEPKPLLVDRTEEIKEWNESIKSGNLNKIADACNHLLVPSILCPWGCSEFIHKAGKIDLYLIFQKHMRKCIITKLKATSLATVEPSRDDYLRDSAIDYDNWLLNPKWKVSPSIAFVDGTPYILSCKSHNGGCKHLHIHCCRWENNLPSALSDQLCHAVIQPRTVKNTQVCYNTIGYQMVEQRYSWKGPDSINISTVGKTNHNLLLLF
jgi:hypothetical protein